MYRRLLTPQGWGRLDLSGCLPLPGLTNSNMRIQVADMGTIKNGESVELTGIRATGSGWVSECMREVYRSQLAVGRLVDDSHTQGLLPTSPAPLTGQSSQPWCGTTIQEI